MSRYIDSDKLLNRFMDYICHDFACSDCKARYYPSGVCRVDKMLREFPSEDVVSRERFDRVLDNLKAVIEEQKESNDADI